MAKKRTAKQDKAMVEKNRRDFYNFSVRKIDNSKFDNLTKQLIYFEKPSARSGMQAMEKNFTLALKQLGKSLPQAESKALGTLMSASYVSGKFGHTPEFNKAEYILNDLNKEARAKGWSIVDAKVAIKEALTGLTDYKQLDYYNVKIASKMAFLDDFTKLTKREFELLQIEAKFAADEAYMLSHLTEKAKSITTIAALRELYSDSEIEQGIEKGGLVIEEDGTAYGNI